MSQTIVPFLEGFVEIILTLAGLYSIYIYIISFAYFLIHCVGGFAHPDFAWAGAFS